MKCDELEIKYVGYGMGFYPTEDVDAAIAELKAENERLECDIADIRDDRKSSVAIIDELNAENAQLKAKLESVQASAYVENVDAGMRERRLRRALWIARAKRANDRAITCNDFAYLGDTEREINMTLARTWMKCRLLKPSEWSKVWNNVERKCLKKAEEYK